MSRRTTIVICAIALLLPAAGVSQVTFEPKRDTVSVGPLGVTGYPYIFYSPETQFSIGGALILSQRLSADTTVKPSNAIISGYYSATHSYDLLFNPEFFLNEDKFYISVLFDYWRFVDKFWGIGNNTIDTANLGYIRKIFSFNTEFDVKVVGPLKVGINYDFNSTTIEDKQLNPFLLAGSVTGHDGGISSGIGGVLFADTRDSPFYPSRGGFYKLSLLTAQQWLGSRFLFSRWILDARQYITLTEPLILAAQFYATAVTGDPPFYQIPALGGDNVMRGYYEGRYRDYKYVALQGEMRWRISRRWGLIVWTGFGDVAREFSALRLESMKPTFGFGLRFALDPKQILNVRADFAWGRESTGIYFNAKEAF